MRDKVVSADVPAARRERRKLILQCGMQPAALGLYRAEVAYFAAVADFAVDEYDFAHDVTACHFMSILLYHFNFNNSIPF